jgi:hypothetical protein
MMSILILMSALMQTITYSDRALVSDFPGQDQFHLYQANFASIFMYNRTQI